MSLRVFIHGISGVSHPSSIVRSLSRQEPHPGRTQTGHHLWPTHRRSRRHRPQLLLQEWTRGQDHKCRGISCTTERPEPKRTGEYRQWRLHRTHVPSILCSVANYECVVVLDNYDREYLVRLNKAIHAKNGGFILAGNLGLYGYTFVDFGEAHRIFDATG